MAKTIFYSLAPLVGKILFCHSKIKFISSPHEKIYPLYKDISPVLNFDDNRHENFRLVEQIHS